MEQHLGRPLKRNEVIHHKDGNKRNNNINNLEVIMLDKHSKLHMTGRKLSDKTKNKISNGYRVCGQKHYNSKLTEEQVILIRNLLEEGHGVRELGRLFNVGHQNISDIKLGKSWKHLL